MLTRWDPFQEMLSLRNTVDRLLDNTFGSVSGGDQEYTWGLALDVVEKGDEFIVKASVPGVNPDDIEVTFANNMLTVKGEIKSDKEEKDNRYHIRERRYGSFSRSITLDSRINADKIQAEYHQGVLTLHLPKAEEVKPKRIAIHGDGKVIEAKVK